MRNQEYQNLSITKKVMVKKLLTHIHDGIVNLIANPLTDDDIKLLENSTFNQIWSGKYNNGVIA